MKTRDINHEPTKMEAESSDIPGKEKKKQEHRSIMKKSGSSLIRFFGRISIAACIVSTIALAADDSADRARADLSKKLGVDAKSITVVTDRTTTWRDGSLGLIKPDEMVTMALVQGRLVVLEAQNSQYLYTASPQSLRFGGPVELWKQSLGYIDPIPNEPNMNGNLVQTSCVGTNPKILLEKVDFFAPQADGSIMATRRTSRSGFTLLFLAKGTINKPIVLGNSFAYGAVAYDPASKRWAALERERLGSSWRVIVGVVGKKEIKELGDPELGNGASLYWIDGLLYAGQSGKYISIDPSKSDAKWGSALPPTEIEGEHGILLNKSESLVVDDENGNTVVSLEWFTGDKKPVATLKGFKMKSFKLNDYGWVFISGKDKDRNAAYMVNIRSGFVLKTGAPAESEIKVINESPLNAAEIHLDWLPQKYHFEKSLPVK